MGNEQSCCQQNNNEPECSCCEEQPPPPQQTYQQFNPQQISHISPIQAEQKSFLNQSLPQPTFQPGQSGIQNISGRQDLAHSQVRLTNEQQINPLLSDHSGSQYYSPKLGQQSMQQQSIHHQSLSQLQSQSAQLQQSQQYMLSIGQQGTITSPQIVDPQLEQMRQLSLQQVQQQGLQNSYQQQFPQEIQQQYLLMQQQREQGLLAIRQQEILEEQRLRELEMLEKEKQENQKELEKEQDELNQMPAKQSLDEPILPQMAQYFQAFEVVDPYHGEIFLLQNKLNPNFKLDMKVETQTDYKSYEKTEKQYQLQKYQFANPHLINIHLIHSKKFLCLCNATFRICLIYDHIYSDLLEIYKQKKRFYEEELWIILDSIIEALYTLQLKGIHHGNITLSHILYSQLFDNSPCYKLQYDKNEKSFYSIILNQNSDKTQLILPNGEILYLSPLLYSSLKNKDNNPQFTIHQDCFALGMCILQLALGIDNSHRLGIDNSHRLLDLYEDYFNDAKLPEIFNEIKYSKKFIEILQYMIKDKPDFIELSQKMNEIRSRRIFNNNKPMEYLYSIELQKRIQNKFQFSKGKEIKDQSSFPTHLSDMQQHTVLQKDNQTDLGIYMDLNQNEIAENRFKGELEIEGGKYFGDIQNGKRDGYGQMEWGDGSFYIGFWKENLKEGKGCLYSKFGNKIYDGQYMGNKYHGFGVLKNDKINYEKSSFDYKNFCLLQDQWASYEGDFIYGRKHGFGTLELSNGEKLVCQFIDDVPSGVGVFHRINKQSVNGKWDNGMLIQEE